METLNKTANIKLQQLLDRTAPHKLYRWLALVALVALYVTRVFYLRGFYIVTYVLGIYNLNLVLGFITPSVDPELEGPVLPSKSDDEYRPFVRRLQEMKFWYAVHEIVIEAFGLGIAYVCIIGAALLARTLTIHRLSTRMFNRQI
jgi:hypothetical protein